jgi:DNA-binding MarR family transcriptional regulator
MTLFQEFLASAGYLFRRAHQHAFALFVDATREFGISPPQYAVLCALHDHPRTSQADVADLIGFDRATTGGLVDRLEAKGLVVRTPDPDDRRAKRLTLTDAGRVLLGEMQDAVAPLRGRYLDPLTEHERSTLLDLLHRVVAAHDGQSRERAGSRSSTFT